MHLFHIGRNTDNITDIDVVVYLLPTIPQEDKIIKYYTNY